MRVIASLTLASAFWTAVLLASSSTGSSDNSRQDAGSDRAKGGGEPIVTYTVSMPKGFVRSGLLQAANKLRG